MKQLRDTITLLAIGTVSTSCTNQYGDRLWQFQLPFFLIIVLSPIYMFFVRKRPKVLAWTLATMWMSFLAYMTGQVSSSNIPVDLVFILPALVLGSILAFWWLWRY